MSLFLLINHTELKSGVQEAASFCSISSHVDCDTVNASDYSELFGIPIAAIGACFYFAILMLSIVGSPRSKSAPIAQRAIAWVALAGAFVDLALFIVQAFVLKNFCLFCLTTYVLTFTLLGTAIALQERHGSGLKALFKDSFRRKISTAASVPYPAVPLVLVAITLFAVVVSLIPSAIRLRSQSYQFVNNAIEQFFQQWKDKPNKKIEAKEGDGTFGNPNAKVRIVEFSDFECPFCRKAAFTMHTALKVMKNRVYFVFKNYPLDSSCNPSVAYQMHPYACRLAQLAYCAVKKDKFWEYHDAAFSSLFEGDAPKTNDVINTALEKGVFKGIFTPAEVEQCFKNEAAMKNLNEDLKLGNTLDVRGTPAVFINGKPVTIPLNLETLQRLVDLEEKLN